MKISRINPFMRYAALQPSVLSEAPLKYVLDHRIFFVLSGEAKIVLKDSSHTVKAGSFVYFPPYTPYYFDGKVKVIVLNFDLDREHDYRLFTYPKTVYDENTEIITENDTPFPEMNEIIFLENAFHLERLLQTCVNHHGFPTDYSDALCSSIIKQILVLAFMKAKSDSEQAPSAVEKAINYIRLNYEKEITNEDVARAVGYHSFYLNRMIKKHTGKTIHSILTAERTNIAKQLLAKTEMAIEKIATESGFNERTKFCISFKKEVGMSPTEYRKQFSKKQPE